MTKTFLLCGLMLALTLSSGCTFFTKKKTSAKESSAISSEVEESFRTRWVDKRVAELVAQGSAAAAARTQAESEFRERFGFTHAAQK